MEEDVEDDTEIKRNVETVGVSLEIQGYVNCSSNIIFVTKLINLVYTYRVTRQKKYFCFGGGFRGAE